MAYENSYKTKQHCVYCLTYHVVFVVKYRRRSLKKRSGILLRGGQRSSFTAGTGSSWGAGMRQNMSTL